MLSSSLRYLSAENVVWIVPTVVAVDPSTRAMFAWDTTNSDDDPRSRRSDPVSAMDTIVVPNTVVSEPCVIVSALPNVWGDDDGQHQS